MSHHSSLYSWSLCLTTHLCTTGVSVSHHSSLYNCISPLISVQLESQCLVAHLSSTVSRYSSLYRSWNLCVSPLISVQQCLTTHLCTTGVSVSALISVQLESLCHTTHLCKTGVFLSHHSVISVQLESVTALSPVRLKFLFHY